MKLPLSTALSAALTIAACASERTAPESAAGLNQTIEDNAATASLGALASMVGESDEIRAFGAKLTADHSRANEAATALAKSLGVNPVETAESPDVAAFNRLQKLSGEEFDFAFAKQMVEEYSEDIAKAEQLAASNEPRIATLADKQLPMLRANLKTAQELTATA